jgi:hypothetical protein
LFCRVVALAPALTTHHFPPPEGEGFGDGFGEGFGAPDCFSILNKIIRYRASVKGLLCQNAEGINRNTDIMLNSL